MVSIEQTSRKYHGRKAATYDEIRVKQERWRVENEVVERMLRDLCPKSVLDCPVGTGRFLPVYKKLRIVRVTGVDVSEEMLALAQKKAATGTVLARGSATELDEHLTYDTVVCVRFLDLIDEDAMRAVVRELCRVARRAVILTIRIGERYVPKTNTATHSGPTFWRTVARCGWQAAERVPVFDAGWEIIRLERRT